MLGKASRLARVRPGCGAVNILNIYNFTQTVDECNTLLHVLLSRFNKECKAA